MAGQNGEFVRQKIFGWPKERDSCESKHSWIAKTNSDGTPNFCPISWPVSGYSSSLFLHQKILGKASYALEVLAKS